MIRIQECKGVPVVGLKDEGRIGYVAEALFDEDSNVRGFLLENDRGIFGKFQKRYISLEDILKINSTICVVYSKDSVKRQFGAQRLKTECDLKKVVGQGVLSKKGESLGIVHDMVFDIETGAPEGLELSKGFMNDMLEGRRIIFMKDGVEFGEEYIIARSEENEK